MSVFTNATVIKDIRSWSMPRLTVSEVRSYVSFNAYDPALGRMRRKKIHLAYCKTRKELRETAARIIKRLVARLEEGWNPWIEAESPTGVTLLSEVFDKYREYLAAQLKKDDLRLQSFESYTSYLHIWQEWCERKQLQCIYQIDRGRVAAFLDYVYVERQTQIRTRNSYLAWLKSWSRWLLDRGYITVDPTAGIQSLTNRKEKNRMMLPQEVMAKVGAYLETHDRYFLLACELLYYCMIRPKEMALLKVGDVLVKDCQIRVKGEIAKNRRTQLVTLPRRVLELMLELGVLEKPSGWYLFSDFCKPGAKYRREDIFRKQWLKVRRELGLPAQYKFYSLKDTGITEMLHKGLDVVAVRDQARHSDISITNIYAARATRANEEIINYEGEM